MLQYDFDKSVGYWLMLTTQSIRRVLETRLNALNIQPKITLRQFECLAWLASDPNMSQNELALAMGIEPPTLAGVVNRMERDGWIEKTNCTDDRRRCRLKPTAQAENRWSEIVAVAHAVRAQAIHGVTDQELQTLRSICDRIRENLAQDIESAAVDTASSEVDEDAVRRELQTIRAM